MKKIIIFTLLGVVIGFAVGWFGAMAHLGHNLAAFMVTSQEREIIEFENSAVDAYYNQPTEAATWALETYIATLNRVKEERASAEVEGPYFFLRPDDSLISSHARLGQLYKKLNNTEKSKYHFEQAMSKWTEIHKHPFPTEEELLAFIHRLDTARASKDTQ